jgi:excinuclease ABC subunit C
LQRVEARRLSALRRRLRECCPRSPGVYGLVDFAGHLIYVGKAKRLRARLLGYFARHSRKEKSGRILRRVKAIVWEVWPDEFAALHRELELIHRHQPRFNVQGQPERRRRAYLCLGRDPAPYLFLSGQPGGKLVARFGPVTAGRRARDAVRWLNDYFGLRDCPQHTPLPFADQEELFPDVKSAGCLRYELGTCLGPCLGACTRAAYAARVRAARSFLLGETPGPLERWQAEMAAASARLDFERAADLRDRLEATRAVREQLDRLREARQRHHFVYALEGGEGPVWYLIRSGAVVGVTAAPGTADARRHAARAVRTAFIRPSPATEPTPALALDGLWLVAAWFRRYPGEATRLLTVHAAAEACGVRLPARFAAEAPADLSFLCPARGPTVDKPAQA